MSGKRCNFIILLAVILLTGPSSLCASTPTKETAGLRQSILALDSAWKRASNDLARKQQDGSLGTADRSDYARFITFLSDRILQYCREMIALGGPAAVAGLPCPDGGDMGGGAKSPAAATTAEQVARLDRSLAEALGEFDELLLREEQRIAARSPRQRETGEGGHGSVGPGGGQAGSEESPEKMQARGTGPGGQEEETGPGGQWEGGEPGGGAAGSAVQTAGGAGQAGGSMTGQGASPPAGDAGTEGKRSESPGQEGGMPPIESGYDDIVARQLREAAEKETDPVLKEKLWEEYHRYKQGIR